MQCTSSVDITFCERTFFIIHTYRGNFGLSLFKKIIDKLIYQEKYPLLDQNMSDFNIGARSKTNINNHLFIIHGITNSVVMGGSECVDIHIYDLIKAFDVLWLSDSMNDLWDTLPEEARDDRLGLVNETSRINRVASRWTNRKNSDPRNCYPGGHMGANDVLKFH